MDNDDSEKNHKNRKGSPVNLELPSFVRDPATGIYLPEGVREQSDCDKLQRKAYERGPLEVKVRTDWIPVILSFVVSIATLIVVSIYTYEAGQQVIESRRAANASAQASDVAAQALRESEMTAFYTLWQMGNQTDAQEEAAAASKSQAATSKRSAEAAENALHITEAADLEPSMVVCSTTPNPLGLDTVVTFWVRNAGKTRAEDDQTTWYIGIEGAPIIPTGTPSIVTLGAGVDFPLDSLTIKNSVNADELSKVNDGVLKLRLWGWSTYRDVFSKHHRVDWNALYEPKSSCNFQITSITTRDIE